MFNRPILAGSTDLFKEFHSGDIEQTLVKLQLYSVKD